MDKLSPENIHERLKRYLIPDVLPIVIDIEKSQGNRIYDSRKGRFILDCFSYFASNPVGHNHPKLMDADFEKRLLQAAKTKPANSDIYTMEMAQFVETFARVAMHEKLQHLFFVEGGALAVENSMKTAFDWKVKKNLAEGHGEKGRQILHFKQAFHGRSGYTLTVTNSPDPRKTKYFPKFDWPRVSNPKLRFPITDEVLAEVVEREEQSVAEIRAAFEAAQGDIAAILIEPIQGEGGDNHFRAEFLQQLRSLADEFEALLIFDEVQTGVGLTGKFWAFEHFDVVPDVLAFGKKMQVCGICAGERIDKVKDNVFVEASRINSTWGGNLVDMVRATRYLEIIEEDSLVENARKVGVAFLDGLQEVALKVPGVLSNARGRGLWLAVDVVSPELRSKIFNECFERGLFILTCGESSIRFRPSLTFTEAEASEALSIFEDSVKAVK